MCVVHLYDLFWMSQSVLRFLWVCFGAPNLFWESFDRICMFMNKPVWLMIVLYWSFMFILQFQLGPLSMPSSFNLVLSYYISFFNLVLWVYDLVSFRSFVFGINELNQQNWKGKNTSRGSKYQSKNEQPESTPLAYVNKQQQQKK